MCVFLNCISGLSEITDVIKLFSCDIFYFKWLMAWPVPDGDDLEVT
jgi:hypothetical protein